MSRALCGSTLVISWNWKSLVDLIVASPITQEITLYNPEMMTMFKIRPWVHSRSSLEALEDILTFRFIVPWFKNVSQNLELANSIQDSAIDPATWFRPEEKPKNSGIIYFHEINKFYQKIKRIFLGSVLVAKTKKDKWPWKIPGIQNNTKAAAILKHYLFLFSWSSQSCSITSGTYTY